MIDLEAVLPATGSIDALRFLQRGRSLLDAVVLVKLHDATMFTGVRITPELVISLRADLNVAGTTITIDDAAVELAWASSGDAFLLRTARYKGSLPELSLSSYQASVALVWANPAGEARIAFGRALADARHNVATEPGSLGAPLFDDAWGVVGLHKMNTGVYVPIAQLVRELEPSPCWNEIAAIHRLVRTVPAQLARDDAKVAPDLAHAVRWSTDDDAKLTERERRRAVASKTLADLRLARGSDPATTSEQRAVDRILAGPPYAPAAIADDILLPFATAARWFRDVVPELPDDESLEREVTRRRQRNALTAIVGPRFAPREPEGGRLREWLADRDRKALVLRGPGGIGKSALLAHFILENESSIRFAWIDFDRPDVSADEASIRRVVDQQLAWQAPQGSLVVVLDSFEAAVQTYGYTNLNPALDALARRFDGLAVVVCSRAPVPLLKVQGEPAQEWELPGLPIEVVTQWLLAENVSPGIAAEIAAVTKGVPLNMKLARDLVKGKSDDEAREIVGSLPKQLVSGYLYRRILRRLRDDTLKEVAQWAMVPRRLVPELLAALLQVKEEESERLFAALRSELTLLEGDAVLTVRADLRNTLLPLLEAEDAARVRKIDIIAANFWGQRASDETAAAEAVYHTLRTGDTARAQQLWRNSVARHLGAYAMEELPVASRAWLEARLSRESADQATEGLLARGDVLEAMTTLRAQPKGVGTLSATRRRRRVEELAAESNLGGAVEAPEPSALEAIVIGSTRPSLRIRDGTFEIESAQWRHLELQRTAVEHAITATGRVQLADGTLLGTATCVGAGLFVTTRTVVDRFAVGSGHRVQLIAGRGPTIDMHAEGELEREAHRIERVVLAHPYWDVAIIEVPTLSDAAPLALATSEPETGIDVVVVGHPARSEEETELVSQLFADAYDVKRLMPGKYVGRQSELSLGRTVNAGCDDATALSPDVGAAVVDPATGQLLGVRFSWVFLGTAKFVPGWEVARDPEFAMAGVLLSGSPQPSPEWIGAWSAVLPARHMLLDAYVARTSGDLERARALLALVADDGEVRIDHLLLQAACELLEDRGRAADLLHELVTQVSRDAWTIADRDAAIATRLRLAVDADAEREFLQILYDQPMVAGLLERRHFRVLVPPGGNLPWNRMTDPTSPSVLGSDSRLPPEAVEVARRIVAASNRCLALRGWIESNASELANPKYLFDRSGSDVRELAAAYVAYPFEQVRPITDFLLEKTDLAPHPIKGWAPIVEPLFMMFREARGGLPVGVKNPKDLEAWLDGNGTSGRLGPLLTEVLRLDGEVAWQAGLLHLTTELPIESLLKRRFSGEKSS